MIPWVDGADPAWLAEKNHYDPAIMTENNAVNRYRDWGLLPWWFRGVETFTPWVRKVYFVTWGHVPEFLNVKAPKLRIVKHDEFIPVEWLPTFSSHAIELNFHHLPELAEHFVYFNDDVFMLRPLQPESFFIDGLPCTCAREVPLELVGKIGTWQHAAVNDLGIINRHFSKKEAVQKFSKKYRAGCYRWKDNLRTLALEKLYPDFFLGFENIHGPAAYLQSIFREVWAAEPDLLERTCMDRFRTSDNVNQWVMLWWQVASGQFSPCVVHNVVRSITEDSIDALCGMISGQKHDFICLNDPDEFVPYDYLADRLKQAFDRILPHKSSFEK